MDLIRPNGNFDDYISNDDFCMMMVVFNMTGQSVHLNIQMIWEKTRFESMQESANVPPEELQVPDVELDSMNSDQRLAFDIVMNTLNNFSQGNENFEPLRMLVSDFAGSGKSYLIKCLTKAVRTLYKSNKSVQILCPTGNSANIISGVTLHSFLKVPTHDRTKDMKPPDGALGEALQKNCDGLKVLLVDERSLVGTTTLGWMEYLCRYGVDKGNSCDKSWGGLPVAGFFGDDVQLPPVCDSPVYKCNKEHPAAMHGVLVWKEFQTCVSLNTMVRQGEAEQFLIDSLSSLRQYLLSPLQAKWLQNFQSHKLKERYGNEIMHQMSENGLYVFPTHEEE